MKNNNKKKKDSYECERVADHIWKETRNKSIRYIVAYKKEPRKRFKELNEAIRHEALLTLKDVNSSGDVKENKTYKFFASMLLDWLKENTKISTYETKRAIIENIIYPNFIDKPMNEITKEDCYGFRNYISEQNYASNYKNAIIVVFKQVFNYAQEYYDVNIDAVKKVKKFRQTEEEKIKGVEPSNIWEPEEFNKFIDCVNSKYYKALFTLSITSWARIGEIQALRWSSYDGHSINVYRNIVKVREKINPKCFVDVSVKTSKGNRIIELPKFVCDMLDEMKLKQMNIPGFSEDWYIFNRWDGKKYNDGTYPQSRTCIDRAFHKGIKQSNVKNIRIHDLRHSGATHAILCNEDIKAVSERLGHADIKTTLEIYHHAIARSKRKLMNNTNDFAAFNINSNDDK